MNERNGSPATSSQNGGLHSAAGRKSDNRAGVHKSAILVAAVCKTLKSAAFHHRNGQMGSAGIFYLANVSLIRFSTNLMGSGASLLERQWQRDRLAISCLRSSSEGCPRVHG